MEQITEKVIITGIKDKKLQLLLLIPAAIVTLAMLIPIIWLLPILNGVSKLSIFAPFVVAAPLSTFYFQHNKTEIIVTNKRVYGLSTYKTRIDIPIEAISAVSCSGAFNTISVTSSSGTIAFSLYKNYAELQSTITELVINNKKNNSTSNNENKQPSLDELVKLKELLEQGIISQQEFDAKKKQLLGL